MAARATTGANPTSLTCAAAEGGGCVASSRARMRTAPRHEASRVNAGPRPSAYDESDGGTPAASSAEKIARPSSGRAAARAPRSSAW